MEEYPVELRSPPLLLVGLVGATQIHPQLTEALHESAVESVQYRRTRYLSFSYDMRIPPCKRGGKDSPSYCVSGILKQRWLEKVCSTVPSVLVVCFDWSEDLEVSQSDRAQAVAQLQHAQRQARERDLRVLVYAVIHHGAADADVVCAVLRQQIEGTSSGLLVSRGMVGLKATAQKLERLVYQSAVAFYTEEEKRLRKLWSPKPSHASAQAVTAMQVRVSFKIGFLSEFRRDARGALMSYIKAYELLTHTAEIGDTVERLNLCNFISFRMYQRYLLSRDMQAAVHQCRIHTQTLRSCGDGERGELGWLRWRLLSVNHQLFAQLLESSSHHAPGLASKADMWQFPGFHYHRAAIYSARLKAWARTAASKESLPAPSGAGGDLVPSQFLGQGPALERPEDLRAAEGGALLEAALRVAHDEVRGALHSDRTLHLLTLAQAGHKERGFAAGAAVCSARIAEECLEEGNLLAAAKLLERLRRDPLPFASQPPPAAAVTSAPPAPGAGAGEAAPWAKWPRLRRATLERSILVGCRELGIKEVPALCLRSRPLLPPAADDAGDDDVGAAKRKAALEEEAAQDEAASPAALRRRLLLDAFEYLAALGASAEATAAEEQAELLRIVSSAVATTAEGGSPVEVTLDSALAEVSFDSSSASGGGTGFSVWLRSPFAATVELAAAAAVVGAPSPSSSSSSPPGGAAAGGAPGAGGAEDDGEEVPLEFVGGAPRQGMWEGGLDAAPLELRGLWPSSGAADGHDREERLLSIRLSWPPSASSGGSAAARLLVRRLLERPPAAGAGAGAAGAAGAAGTASTAAEAGSLGDSSAAAGSWALKPLQRISLGGLPRPRGALPRLRVETWLPVEPSSALASEPFVVHVLVFLDPPPGEAAIPQPLQLQLSCSARAVEDTERRFVVRGDEPTAFVLGSGAAAAVSGATWRLLPVGEGDEQSQVVAEVLSDGSLRPSGGLFSLSQAELAGMPLLRRSGGGGAGVAGAGSGSKGAPPPKPLQQPLLSVPVVVRCGRDCRASLSASVGLRLGGSKRDLGGASASAPAVSLHFHTALQVSFDERSPGAGAGAGLAPALPPRLPRRFSLKSLTGVPIELEAAELVEGPAAAPKPPVRVLGKLGLVAPGSLHVFALPHSAASDASATSSAVAGGGGGSGAGVVSLRFSRAGAVGAFFPWAAGRARLDAAALGRPPLGAAEWPLPRSAAGGAAASAAAAAAAAGASSAALAVELEHCSEGKVAEPLEVRVRVRGAARGAVELRIRLIQADVGAEGQERYYVSGPTSSQGAYLPGAGDPQGQVCATFVLVPLAAGALHLPRVQVSGGEQELTSASSTVFIFPATQCALSRAVA